MPSETETAARHLAAEIYRETAGLPQRWCRDNIRRAGQWLVDEAARLYPMAFQERWSRPSLLRMLAT